MHSFRARSKFSVWVMFRHIALDSVRIRVSFGLGLWLDLELRLRLR
jgi:hypothetical protein